MTNEFANDKLEFLWRFDGVFKDAHTQPVFIKQFHKDTCYDFCLLEIVFSS